MEEKTIEGKFKVVDEMCRCGHPRSSHEPKTLSIPELNGHGQCEICGAVCEKFTWRAWVVN